MITIKMEGFKELEDALRKLPQEIAGKVMREALKRASRPMADEAKRRAPRSSDPGPQGHMADSIDVRTMRVTPDGSYDVETHLWIGPDRDHFYGLFSEFGTVRQSARPFMRPAFDGLAEETIKQFGNELGDSIERAARRLKR